MAIPGNSGNTLTFYWLAGGVHSGQKHKLNLSDTTFTLLSFRYMKLLFSRD